jgi:hypothetical protein
MAKVNLAMILFRSRGQDNTVGIMTHYGLDGPGIKSQWG